MGFNEQMVTIEKITKFSQYFLCKNSKEIYFTGNNGFWINYTLIRH